MINVTKTFLPDFDKYVNRLKPLWENRWITNRGKYVLELEENLKNILKVNHLLCVNNGMSALMLAIKALDIKGEVITTPFSYVATTGALLWENCTPIFVDIRKDTFCIDADKIEQAITNRTTAIVATHVFGMTCDIEKIEKIAAKHQLKVIYDAAHAFGVTYKGQSVFNYGDISISSFHATKLFHTVEGGAVICNQPSLEHKILLLHQFGHLNDSYEEMGINAKMSEFHAAMGLEMIPYLSYIIQTRKKLYIQYKEKLRNLPILY